MEVWGGASSSERKQFFIISELLAERRELLDWLFDPERARLRHPAEVLKNKSSGLSSGDRVLIKIAIDLWCEQGGAQITDLQSLDPQLVRRVLRVLEVFYA